MTASLSIVPKTTALLVLDVQTIIMEGAAAPQSALEKAAFLQRIKTLAEAARAANIRVIYVRTGYPEASPRNKAIAYERQSGRFHDEDEKSPIDPMVAPQPGDIVITKHRVSAFFGTELDLILRANGITSVILTGLATSRVVMATLRYAADADYEIFLAADCCSDVDPQVHATLISKVFPQVATVATQSELVAALRAR